MIEVVRVVVIEFVMEMVMELSRAAYLQVLRQGYSIVKFQACKGIDNHWHKQHTIQHQVTTAQEWKGPNT